MNYDEFTTAVLAIIPEAQFESANDGQVIIYTNKQKSDFEESESRDSSVL